MVKFRDDLKVRVRSGKLHLNDSIIPPNEKVALTKFKEGRWERVDSLPEEQIEMMRQKAQSRLARAIADLNTDFYLFLPNGMEVASAIDFLNGLDSVELAQPVPLPQAPPLAPDFFDSQLYLNEAPVGIDAIASWNRYESKGSGIRVADLEYEFNESHQDLPSIQILGPTPAESGFGKHHGTAVLGELFALPNGWGTTGIVPDADPYFVGTYNGQVWNVGGAIGLSGHHGT